MEALIMLQEGDNKVSDKLNGFFCPSYVQADCDAHWTYLYVSRGGGKVQRLPVSSSTPVIGFMRQF
jgi:hypothetical protein